MVKKYILTTGAATTVTQSSFGNDINVMIFVLACGVTHAANRALGLVVRSPHR
jgi:hypothetical protein